MDQSKIVFTEIDVLACNLSLIVTNRSSVPIFSQTVHEKAADGKRARLLAYSARVPTKFPIFLQSYESRAILLSYVPSKKARALLRLPSARNRREPVHNASWACRIQLATSRGDLRIRLQAKIVSPESVFEMLDKECQAEAAASKASNHPIS